MSEQIKKIVQAEDPILNNLADTENRLNELNQEVGAILDDYHQVNAPKPSFFNFDNPFFLVTLVGLFMLAFALWFLQQELKHQSKTKKSKVKAKQIEKAEVKTSPKIVEKEEKKEEKKSLPKAKTSSKKARKIKVVKVK